MKMRSELATVAALRRVLPRSFQNSNEQADGERFVRLLPLLGSPGFVMREDGRDRIV
jgi:hypothetical protein